MKLKYALSIVLAAHSTVFAASFDCTNAGTSIEKAVCSNGKLNQLDDELASNYKTALSLKLDDAARTQLRDSQRHWVKQRNTCTDVDCIADAYLARISVLQSGGISTVPTKVPPSAASGSVAASANAVTTAAPAPEPEVPVPVAAKPIPAPMEAVSAPMEAVSAPAPASTTVSAPKDQDNVTIQAAKAAWKEQRTALTNSGFTSDELNSDLQLKTYPGVPYQQYMTFGEYLALLSKMPAFTINPVHNDTFKGFTIKAKGQPSFGFLFRFDGGDAFVAALVQSNDVTLVNDDQDSVAATYAIARIADKAAEVFNAKK